MIKVAFKSGKMFLSCQQLMKCSRRLASWEMCTTTTRRVNIEGQNSCERPPLLWETRPKSPKLSQLPSEIHYSQIKQKKKSGKRDLATGKNIFRLCKKGRKKLNLQRTINAKGTNKQTNKIWRLYQNDHERFLQQGKTSFTFSNFFFFKENIGKFR